MPGRPTRRQVHVNRPLSNVSVAYKNTAYIWDQVFPRITVQKQSDLYFIWDKQAWFQLRAGTRAPGTKAPRADYGVSTASYICLNYSLAKGVPDEVRDNADAPLRPDITATNFVTDGLLISTEDRVATLVSGSGNWASASNPGTKWSTDTSDAWGDHQTAVGAVEDQIGRSPNVAVYGVEAWRTLSNHPDLIDRVKYQRVGGKLEPSDLMGWFGFEKVLIGKALKDIALEGQTASMTKIWGDMFWCGYVTNAPAIDEPSAGYTFEWGNRSVQRIRDDLRHEWVIEAEHWMDEVITASDAGAGFYDVS